MNSDFDWNAANAKAFAFLKKRLEEQQARENAPEKDCGDCGDSCGDSTCKVEFLPFKFIENLKRI